MKIWLAGLVIVLGLATSSNSHKVVTPLTAFLQETDPGLGSPPPTYNFCQRVGCDSAPPQNSSGT
jgi:hypothetical protein